MQQACEYFCDSNEVDEEINEKRLERLSDDLSESFDTSAIDPVISFKNLYTQLKPELSVEEIKEKHKHSTIDPFIRLTQLETELTTTAKEIAEYIKLNRSNFLLSQTENFLTIIDELDKYKAKLNSFYESPGYKGAKEKSTSALSKDAKKEYSRLITEYSKSTKKLFDSINQLENNKSFDLNEVLSENIDFIADIDTKQKVDFKDIEAKISSLENTIGKWEIYKRSKTIGQLLSDKVVLIQNDTHETKTKLMTEFGNLLNSINEFKTNSPEMFEQYIKIKDAYARIELYESFDEVFDYLKKRLKAVRTFHQESDKFKGSCDALNQKIIINEKSLEELGKKFTTTIDEFNKLELLLKDFNEIENVIKQKYMI